ncbi:MAG: hypothetical protein ABSE05_17510 [Syntrophales bacterium]|jgi:hypothetical protein
MDMPPLPTSEDTLFSTAEDWWNNACLNFLHEGWALYTIGYKEAADILVDKVKTSRRRQDTLVYPIVFLYRQYLELAIKDLIRRVYKLHDIDQEFPKTHHIDRLWPLCSKLMKQTSLGDSENEFGQIRRLLSEFALVDPTSEAFRYPEDKCGKRSLPEMRHINLRNLKEVIAKIAVIFSGVDAMIDHYLSLKVDA